MFVKIDNFKIRSLFWVVLKKSMTHFEDSVKSIRLALSKIKSKEEFDEFYETE